MAWWVAGALFLLLSRRLNNLQLGHAPRRVCPAHGAIAWRLVDGGQQNRVAGRELALNRRHLAMSQTGLIALVVVAAILIVFGRVNRRTRWGNWVAVAGFAVLALAALLRVMT
jgi:hypothetical protein